LLDSKVFFSAKKKRAGEKTGGTDNLFRGEGVYILFYERPKKGKGKQGSEGKPRADSL